MYQWGSQQECREKISFWRQKLKTDFVHSLKKAMIVNVKETVDLI